MNTSLHEILAVENDRQSAAEAIINETIQTLNKKPDHFIGKHVSYMPFDETAMDAEEATKELVTTVREKLKHCFKIAAVAIDVTATKDETNREAMAEIIVNGVTLTEHLPATTLLMLENRLKKWLEVLMATPTLAPGRTWIRDDSRGQGVYVDNNPDAKFRTKKVMCHKVLVEPTPHHPAQIEKWSEDERVGKITETTWCSMLPPSEKSTLIEKATNLLAAVKQARQRANQKTIVNVSIGDKLASYILGS